MLFISDSLVKDKYRYNFLMDKKIIRRDNAPHHPEILNFPHHLHIDSEVVESQEPTLEQVLNYVKKFI
ncbi:MAG: toxin-antitoxin system TumE family protein [Promethearchaeota archaeon]